MISESWYYTQKNEPAVTVWPLCQAAIQEQKL